MSDDDQGSDANGFLKRWSQRKLEAKEPQRETPSLQVDVQPLDIGEEAPVEEFDLSSLPKLEDLTAMTDIRMFLQKGVPESLRNAALRKAWALDPAIRNYVSPALEYAYDWNTPGGVPGSSEIGIGMDVARLVSQIMGSDENSVPEAPSDGEGQPLSSSARFPYDATQKPEPGHPSEAVRVSETVSMPQSAPNVGDFDCEAQKVEGYKETNSAAPQPGVRRHGSARPLD